MTTDQLRSFLGSDYEDGMQHTVEGAFLETLMDVVPRVATSQRAAG